ncbi:YkgJ family cysteine cluster protein [Burkholderia contaminans]|uniref:YkgJ family cysteine cluster protein n=1 Tax=Burkholderia contaminans TaxID=488447 RepID=UPI003116EF0F
MDIDFECTKCGKCCYDLRLPLTVTEALAWLERGNDVQILCDASPWPEEPPKQNLLAVHRRRRSFAAMSGSLPARVVVILAGAYAGPCPNLRPDMRCGIYEQRPLVCRIYPAEINPFIELTPMHKACPPDAWTPGSPPLLRSGKLVGAGIPPLTQQSRDIDASDVPIKQEVCRLLGIDRAAVWNEGFVAYSPDRVDLLAALHQACGEPAMPTPLPTWHFVSNRRAAVEALFSVGALSSLVHANSTMCFEYLGFSEPVQR